MKVRSYALPELWSCYDRLPFTIQHQADKQFALFQANPEHPSLRFKETGPYWSARVSRGYRALARPAMNFSGSGLARTTSTNDSSDPDNRRASWPMPRDGCLAVLQSKRTTPAKPKPLRHAVLVLVDVEPSAHRQCAHPPAGRKDSHQAWLLANHHSSRDEHRCLTLRWSCSIQASCRYTVATIMGTR